jgi:hypothetical protein
MEIRMRHLTAEALLEQMDRKTRKGEPDEVGQHLTSCIRCREQFAELEELVGFLDRDRANEPPPEALEWSLRLFQPVLRPHGGRSRVFEIARRVFDSYDQVLEGVRGPGGASRQLLYRAGGLDVDLKIEPGEGGLTLAGQLLSEQTAFPAETQVRLESGGVIRFATSTNAVGEFTFDHVPEDTYHLSLELPEGELKLFCVNRPAVA